MYCLDLSTCPAWSFAIFILLMSASLLGANRQRLLDRTTFFRGPLCKSSLPERQVPTASGPDPDLLQWRVLSPKSKTDFLALLFYSRLIEMTNSFKTTSRKDQCGKPFHQRFRRSTPDSIATNVPNSRWPLLVVRWCIWFVCQTRQTSISSYCGERELITFNSAATPYWSVSAHPVISPISHPRKLIYGWEFGVWGCTLPPRPRFDLCSTSLFASRCW